VLILLDTCTISDFVKGDTNTLVQIKNHPPGDIAVSAITLMEVEYGLLLNPGKAKNLRPILDEFFASISIIAFGHQEAICASKIRADLKQSGTPIGAYDLLIAATAITHNLKLITATPKEFERIQGLFWENWRLG
jgi:tRNA(fMet)-specific endonuclease VapC